ASAIAGVERRAIAPVAPASVLRAAGRRRFSPRALPAPRAPATRALFLQRSRELAAEEPLHPAGALALPAALPANRGAARRKGNRRGYRGGSSRRSRRDCSGARWTLIRATAPTWRAHRPPRADRSPERSRRR